MKNKTFRYVTLLAVALLVSACAGQKDAATQAVAAIEASLSSIRDDAGKYAAGELQQAEAGLASLQDGLSKKDYKSVVAAAPAVSAQVASLTQSVSTRRDEALAAAAVATEQWKILSTEVPEMVSAIQSRVDILGQAKKLPKNLSADSYQAAKEGLESMKSGWTQATSQFGTGNPVDAVATAEAVKSKGAEVLKLLGMG